MKKSLLYGISVLASVIVFSVNFSSFAGNCCFKGEKQSEEKDSSRPQKKTSSPPKSQPSALPPPPAEKRSSPLPSPRSSVVVPPSGTAGNTATPSERDALISEAQRRVSAERQRQEREQLEAQQAAASAVPTEDAELMRVQQQLAEAEKQLALERTRTSELLPVLQSCHAVLAALTEQGVECTVTEGTKGSRLTLLIPEGHSTIFFAETNLGTLQDRTLRRTVSGALSTHPETSLNVDNRQGIIATELQTIGRRLTASSGEGPLRTRLQELFANVARTIDNAGRGDVRRARGESATPNLTLVSLQEGSALILGVSDSSTPKFSQDPLSTDSDRRRKIEAKPGKGVPSLLDTNVTVRTPLLSPAASSDDDAQ